MKRILIKVGEFYPTGTDDEITDALVAEFERYRTERATLHHKNAVVLDTEKARDAFFLGANFGSEGSVMWIQDRIVTRVLEQLPDVEIELTTPA